MSSEIPEPSYQTISFPTGAGSPSLCARCSSLLSYFITYYGDGTGYEDVKIVHSPSSSQIPDESIDNVNIDAKWNETYEIDNSRTSLCCVICIKSEMLFDAARTHVSFESSLKHTPREEWSLDWHLQVLDPKLYPAAAFPRDHLRIFVGANHKNGYGWGIGCFAVYPDWSGEPTGSEMQQPSLGDYPIIIPLDPIESTATQSRSAKQPELDLQSTLGTGSLAVLSSWIQECATSHPKCPRVFKGNPGWFPDRLVHITCTESSVTTGIGYPKVDLAARIVLRSNPSDFSPDKTAAGIIYISLSHCWGPPPDPSAPLGGRADSVLTTSKLSNWLTEIPLKDLPLTFQHAIIVCAQLSCEYLWIDSLCIVQDSLEDWQTQSAVMGDIYKFAFLNIAILSTTSDYEGFINPARDTRVDFGFRTSFASLLGRSREEKNGSGQECVLLRGSAKLLWSFQSALPMSSASNAPLCNRAWVYQERCLARRTLAFAANSMYWACDEGSRGEQPEWAVAGLESTGLRRLLHSSHEIAETARAQGQTRLSLEQHWAVFSAFDMHWHSCVTSYSQCKLTRLTDKLVAISAVARELHSTLNLGDLRYLAGLWEINLPFQLAWITVKGRTTPARARVGDREYVAPSWSWASVDAPVQPRLICRSGGGFVALAVARAAEVALDTGNTFGSVKAGWLRLRGCLNHVRAADLYEPADLVDKVTGEELGFCSDTVEGYGMMGSESDLRKIVWVPLTLQFAGAILRCTYLVLIEDELHGGGAFVKTGEKVYRRIGCGDFGRHLSVFRTDKLLMELGTFPDIEALDGQGEALMQGFKKREDTLEEFVLI